LWFVLVFSFDRLLFGKSNAEALAWAAGLSAVYALVDYFAWRRRRV
jgi:hypothetical protein